MQATQRGVTVADALKIMEFRTKIVSASSVLIGTAWAATAAHRFNLVNFLLVLGGALFVDLGTAGFNSYFDFVRGVDTVETDADHYKVLVHRPIAPRVALYLALGAFTLAGICGLVLGARIGWTIVEAGAVCMAIAFFYSGGPLPIASTPVGEIFAGGMLGSVLIAIASYAQTQTVDGGVLLLGLPSTTLLAAILAVNNTCDMRGDAAAGRRTLAIVLGPAGAQIAHYSMIVATYLLAVGLVSVGVLPRLGLVPLALAALFAARTSLQMHRRGYSHTTKGPSMGGISAIFIVYSVAVLIALGLRAAGAS